MTLQEQATSCWERVVPPKTQRIETGPSHELGLTGLCTQNPCHVYRNVCIHGLSLEGKTKTWLDKGLTTQFLKYHFSLAQ